ncbi:MAG: helix-turn-helix domain-containing protein [Actinomycetota bacterium]
MDFGKVLRESRRKAGLSQRQLARLAGVAQPAIARLESGRAVPRVDLLDRLLKACGVVLEPAPRPGLGVDTTGMVENLVLSPERRLRKAVEDNQGLDELLAQARLD